MKRSVLFAMALGLASAAVMLASNVDMAAAADKPIRVGIIGLDTSHVVAFTKAMNDPKAVGPLANVRVVAAFPAGSDDVEASFKRIKGFTETVQKMDVEIVDSIETLLTKVDAVLLESVDGRPHLEQVRPVFAAGKPVFIDKPVAGSLKDAVEIYRLAQEHNVPCFSSSSLRFSPGILGMLNNEKIGDVIGCDAYGPCSLEPHHPDLYWYGVHGVEILFTIMGNGCETVTRAHTDGTDVAMGIWEGGRVGTFRGIRQGKAGYGALVFGSKGVGPSGGYGGYEPMLIEIAKFFATGKPPITAEDTLQIMAFMEAADESKRQGGAPVKIADVLKKAGYKSSK